MTSWRVPLACAAAGSADLESSLPSSLSRLLSTSHFILGPEVSAFEAEIATYLGVPHAVGVSSGTDALFCALRALDVGPSDEIVTTPFTFVATAEAVVRAGARPVFADVEPGSLNLAPAAAEAAVTARTKALLPVHLFGHPADLDALGALAARHGLAVVEDAAQATGARYRGRAVGGFGAAGCFSFFPTKPLGALGDGGLIATRDAALDARLRRLRQHGASEKHVYQELGGNFRLDALQAAFLRVKLPHLDDWLAARRAHAAAYDDALRGLDGVGLPLAAAGTEPAWAHYVVRVRDGRRDALAAFLAERGIETGVYYPRPLHLQPAFAYLGHRAGEFPEAERAAREVLALPLFPELTVEQRGRVVDAVRDFFR